MLKIRADVVRPLLHNFLMPSFYAIQLEKGIVVHMF
jgi:hypothetical protein